MLTVAVLTGCDMIEALFCAGERERASTAGRSSHSNHVQLLRPSSNHDDDDDDDHDAAAFSNYQHLLAAVKSSQQLSAAVSCSQQM